jgi:hypothetical protein
MLLVKKDKDGRSFRVEPAVSRVLLAGSEGKYPNANQRLFYHCRNDSCPSCNPFSSETPGQPLIEKERPLPPTPMVPPPWFHTQSIIHKYHNVRRRRTRLMQISIIIEIIVSFLSASSLSTVACGNYSNCGPPARSSTALSLPWRSNQVSFVTYSSLGARVCENPSPFIRARTWTAVAVICTNIA